VLAEHDYHFSPIRILAASNLNLLCICFWLIVVYAPDLPAFLLMCLWFFCWSSVFHWPCAILGHQIPAWWPYFYINLIVHWIVRSVLQLMVRCAFVIFGCAYECGFDCALFLWLSFTPSSARSTQPFPFRILISFRKPPNLKGPNVSTISRRRTAAEGNGNDVLTNGSGHL